MRSLTLLLKHWQDISIAKRLYFVVGAMATLIAGELLAMQFAMHTLSAARAFVGGEGLWSKAQKNAAISLQHYRLTGDEASYAQYLEYLQIPEGDHIARLELQKAEPNLAIVRQGFLQGHIQPADITPMIDLIRRFHKVSSLARAIDAWTRADELLEEYKKAGDRYHTELVSKNARDAQSSLLHIKELNEELSLVEDEFSFQLGAASHWVENVVLALLSIAVLIVETCGLTLTFLTIRGISSGLDRLNRTALSIGQGEFTEQGPRIRSQDEIGKLADSIEKMGQLLKVSYRDLESRVTARTAELTQSRDQLGVILREMSDGITVVDSSGKYIFANEIGAKMCGFNSAQELLGLSEAKVLENFDVIDNAGNPFPVERLPSRLAFNDGKNEPEALVRSRNRTTGAEKWSLVNSTPVFDTDKNIQLVITILKDFTEHKRNEDSVKFLDEANKILSTSLDYETTLKNLTKLIVPKFADWCSINVIDETGQTPRNIAVTHSLRRPLVVTKESLSADWRVQKESQGIFRRLHAALYSDVPRELLTEFAKDTDDLEHCRPA